MPSSAEIVVAALPAGVKPKSRVALTGPVAPTSDQVKVAPQSVETGCPATDDVRRRSA